eukprot:TRINITY_DN12616_c0_g1_i1.p1 TRINITY_DN12616_c0_g1~~TRINITY_DN12616_c0_g1_i1.p1  ORF type:complete len:260 (-),score=66.46 TRINITY_DN12616_c0_g1_i1:13-792(-)
MSTEKNKKPKPAHLFLFNDALLITNKEGKKYRLKYFCLISKANKIEQDGHGPAEFHFITSTRTFLFFGSNAEEKAEWARAIQSQITHDQNSNTNPSTHTTSFSHFDSNPSLPPSTTSTSSISSPPPPPPLSIPPTISTSAAPAPAGATQPRHPSPTTFTGPTTPIPRFPSPAAPTSTPTRSPSPSRPYPHPSTSPVKGGMRTPFDDDDGSTPFSAPPSVPTFQSLAFQTMGLQAPLLASSTPFDDPADFNPKVKEVKYV